eukprot:TRINITY_DN67493_c0_g1_i1.p1 TRINITY_DN67493_c0_g1~~TRINITY_DN67493_c0_g1_i1.p1  ORF type:complete len:465 (+),score=80.52 TRINITY_DN67493_c0_g1_i1:27-1397(+)
MSLFRMFILTLFVVVGVAAASECSTEADHNCASGLVRPRLWYFGIRGKAEPTRLLLAHLGVDYDIVVVGKDNGTWLDPYIPGLDVPAPPLPAVPEHFPFGQVPVWEEPVSPRSSSPVLLTQSVPILRYIARVYSTPADAAPFRQSSSKAGSPATSPLLGTTALDAARVEELMGGIDDVKARLGPLFYPAASATPQMRVDAARRFRDVDAPRFVGGVERLLRRQQGHHIFRRADGATEGADSDSDGAEDTPCADAVRAGPFAVGRGLTLADFALFPFAEQLALTAPTVLLDPSHRRLMCTAVALRNYPAYPFLAKYLSNATAYAAAAGEYAGGSGSGVYAGRFAQTYKPPYTGDLSDRRLRVALLVADPDGGLGYVRRERARLRARMEELMAEHDADVDSAGGLSEFVWTQQALAAWGDEGSDYDAAAEADGLRGACVRGEYPGGPAETIVSGAGEE